VVEEFEEAEELEGDAEAGAEGMAAGAIVGGPDRAWAAGPMRPTMRARWAKKAVTLSCSSSSVLRWRSPIEAMSRRLRSTVRSSSVRGPASSCCQLMSLRSSPSAIDAAIARMACASPFMPHLLGEADQRTRHGHPSSIGSRLLHFFRDLGIGQLQLDAENDG